MLCTGSPAFGAMTAEGLLGSFAPYVLRKRKRLVGALEKFDGHEHHLLVAEILQVVDLVLPRSIGFVAGFARRVGIFDRRAVMHVLASASAAHRGPEIVEHMTVKADALTRLQTDH